MKAYHYDELRFFDNEVECQLDPLETKKQGEKVFLIPANATTKKPIFEEGSTPRWDGASWEQYADDKQVYGFTNNMGGTVKYFGHEHTEEELQAKHKEVTLLFAEKEPVSALGKYWLDETDPAYLEAKKQEEREKAIATLDRQYNADKAVLSEQYTMAMLTDDTELGEEIKAEIVALNEDYDKAYEEIVGGE